MLLCAALWLALSAKAGVYDVVVTQDDYYQASTPIELVSTIPAVNYNIGSDRHFRRVAHVLIPNLKPGDILTISSNFEITNDLGTIAEFAAALVLTPTSTGTAGLENMGSLSNSNEPSSGKFITRFPGYNLTPNQGTNFPHGGMHHGMMPLNAVYKVPEGVSGNQYVAIMSYVAGSQYWPTSEYVTVEPYAGWLQVKVERNQ
jgi:hypothetical protein